jgi:hypothetical protein
MQLMSRPSEETTPTQAEIDAHNAAMIDAFVDGMPLPEGWSEETTP